MSSKTIPIPTVRVGGAIGPLPRGLTGWIARIADRASNRADRSNLPFDGEIDALFYRRAALPAPVGERAAAEASATRAEPPQDEPGLLIADLHSDTLLWGVDPLAARSGGHMDLPRLIAARSGLQVFGGPTWTPLPMRNSEQALCVSCESIDQSDALFPSQLLERARRGKAASRRKRAYKLAERFHQMLHRDGGRATQAIYRPEDLQGLWRGLGAPGPKNGRIGMMLSLEGLHWLEPDEDPAAVRAEIAALRAAGFRMIAPTHRFSNGMGGASEDCQGRMGLTRAGHAAFSACFESGVAVDLAHASPALIRDVAGLALTHGRRPRPVIVSHAGVRATNRQPRNLRDADIRAVASTGGLIGVGVWMEAIGFAPEEPFEAKIEKIVDAFAAVLAALSDPEFHEEMLDRYGRYDPYEHIAVGSDFDGAVTTPFDVTGLSWLLAALGRRTDPATGAALFPKDKLRLIAGENARRALAAALAED